MKVLVGIFITIFIVFMSYVFIGGSLQKNSSESNSGNTQTPSQPATTGASPAATFTTSEVAPHDTYDDCWLIISDKVYNVTDFLGQHPGGASAIIPHCGKDATQAFATQDRGSSGGHSMQATEMLTTYLIGSIK